MSFYTFSFMENSVLSYLTEVKWPWGQMTSVEVKWPGYPPVGHATSEVICPPHRKDASTGMIPLTRFLDDRRLFGGNTRLPPLGESIGYSL